MAIQLADNFSYQGGKPLDASTGFQSNQNNKVRETKRSRVHRT